MTVRRIQLPEGQAGEKDCNDYRDRPEIINQAVDLDQPAPSDPDAGQQGRSVALDDFRAYMPDHRYIFMPTRDLWPASSVDARIPWPEGPNHKPMKPSRWLDENAPVEQMTWLPGADVLIRGRLIDTGGWIDHPGVTTFNLYRPPTLRHGNPKDVDPWISHVRKVYPQEADHIIRWLAHRVQKPGEKINHAVVMGGKQGIGKDSILEPVKQAVGPWNVHEVSPAAIQGRFNAFIKSVILRISEARDLGEIDRFAFYDHTKTLTTAPPDVLRCDEKNIREHAVPNVCGVIITTNHKSDGIYLPADDRRHFVAWSECQSSDFEEGYWIRLWTWYHSGGIGNVAAYLATLDLTDFDPKAPPPKTDAFWHIVNAARPPEETELADVLDHLKTPDALTLDLLVGSAEIHHPGFAEWLKDRRNRRKIPHRLESAGYEPVRNDDSKDGLWKVGEKRQVVYASNTISLSERLMAVERLIKERGRAGQ
jgi:hypothetical protein